MKWFLITLFVATVISILFWVTSRLGKDKIPYEPWSPARQSNSECLLVKARALFALGRTDEALKAISMEKDDFFGNLNLGYLNFALEKYDLARECFEKALDSGRFIYMEDVISMDALLCEVAQILTNTPFDGIEKELQSLLGLDSDSFDPQITAFILAARHTKDKKDLAKLRFNWTSYQGDRRILYSSQPIRFFEIAALGYGDIFHNCFFRGSNSSLQSVKLSDRSEYDSRNLDSFLSKYAFSGEPNVSLLLESLTEGFVDDSSIESLLRENWAKLLKLLLDDLKGDMWGKQTSRGTLLQRAIIEILKNGDGNVPYYFLIEYLGLYNCYYLLAFEGTEGIQLVRDFLEIPPWYPYSQEVDFCPNPAFGEWCFLKCIYLARAREKGLIEQFVIE